MYPDVSRQDARSRPALVFDVGLRKQGETGRPPRASYARPKMTELATGWQSELEYAAIGMIWRRPQGAAMRRNN